MKETESTANCSVLTKVKTLKVNSDFVHRLSTLGSAFFFFLIAIT